MTSFNPNSTDYTGRVGRCDYETVTDGYYVLTAEARDERGGFKMGRQ